jgi:hypothetical protein
MLEAQQDLIVKMREWQTEDGTSEVPVIAQ